MSLSLIRDGNLRNIAFWIHRRLNLNVSAFSRFSALQSYRQEVYFVNPETDSSDGEIALPIQPFFDKFFC